MKLIAICGPKGSGKTTVADRLIEQRRFLSRPFAATLKTMLLSMGLTYDQVYGDEKEKPIDWLGGVTARHCMQTLGTEWGRKLIADDLWVRVWKQRISNLTSHVVVDDLRFPNEAEAVRELGGTIWRVERPGFEHSSEHESEKHVIEAGTTLLNDGTIEDLNRFVDDRFESVK